MSLQAQLDVFKASWVERVGPDAASLVAADNTSLQPLAACALGVGAQFPPTVLTNHKGGKTDIGDLFTQGPLVVIFYRGGWCPYCNLELRAYQQHLPEITAFGARLVAISPEAPDKSLSTAEKNALSFEVLSDAKGKLAAALGIRFQLSPAIRALYEKFGHDLPAHNADDVWSLPMPSAYVVEKGGRIAHASVEPDYRIRLDPQVALHALSVLASARAG